VSSGQHTGENGEPAIIALSWKQVDGIVKPFFVVEPVERDAVPGSSLKIEDDN
jgi:hypothetical protein